VTDVFKAAGSRSDREFYDDILLVDPLGQYIGMIAMRTLTRLQMTFLLGNIERVEASRREIREKNLKMEAELRMAREIQPTNINGPLIEYSTSFPAGWRCKR